MFYKEPRRFPGRLRPVHGKPCIRGFAMSSISVFTLEIAQKLFESTEQFPVSFDDAWVWLEFSRKDNAKSSLSSCGFVKDLDYVSAYLDRQGCLTDKTSDEKGKFSEVIKLSCDCFKSWGMMLKTPVGQRIRSYFLECERLLKLTVAKQPQTQAEIILASAQLLVDIERRQLALEAENEKIKAELAEQKETAEVHDLEIAANSAELERFKNGHGAWFSIIGYRKLKGLDPISTKQAANLGRKASALCKLNNIKPEKITDPRFGTVGVYPDWILSEVVI